MASSRDLHVALAADENYFPGLLVAAASIAFFSDDKADLSLHILDGGISDKSWCRLRAAIGRLHPKAQLNRLSVLGSGICEILDDGKKGPMAYARLVLPRLIDAKRVVYVDSDCLSLSDLGDLFDFDLRGHPLAAVQDPITMRLADDYPWSAEPPPEKPYFNSGLLLIDVDQWRKEKVTEHTLEVLQREGPRCTYWDQTALNYVLQNRWQQLPSRWNYPSNGFDHRRAEEVSLVHFLCNEKPWFGDSGSEAHELWRWFANDVAGFTAAEWPLTLSRDRLRLEFFEKAAGLISAFYRGKARCYEIFRRSSPNESNQWAASYWRQHYAARHEWRKQRSDLRRFLAAQAKTWTEVMSLRSKE